jgi:hypothetical protein
LGVPAWRRDATYPYRGQRRLRNEQVVMIRLTGLDPAVDGSQRVDVENEDYDHSLRVSTPEIDAPLVEMSRSGISEIP